MEPHEILFTPTEAAVLTGLPLKAVNNAIDKKTISAVSGEEGGRLLDARALVLLSIERRLSDRIGWRFDRLPATQSRVSPCSGHLSERSWPYDCRKIQRMTVHSASRPRAGGGFSTRMVEGGR
jgi:hypothetical protein